MDEDATDVDREDATDVTRREGPGERRAAAPAKNLDRGTRIGRYVILDILGAGGMGVVYAAHDPELDRKVAIKVLQARPGGSESGGQAWLLREAQAMARLAHPNVVAVHDVGAISADQVFVAMELVEGETLRTWLKQPRGWRDVVGVMRAAAAGLAAAHAAGLVHRDFKPDNVIVGRDGRTRVMDFGLARLRGDPAEDVRDVASPVESKSPLFDRLTVTGALLGTPAYMAPEIYAGKTADARTDQFAFGVALYEALFRVRPFDRKALVEDRATAPTPPATPKVPARIARVALRAIALDPAQRFAAMDDAIAALATDPPQRWLLVAGAGAVVASGAVAIALAVSRGGGEPPPPPAPEPCTDAPAKLAQVWGTDARGAVEAGFTKLGKPYVADALAGTTKALDGYGAAWVAMRTEACRATRVHGSQSEAALDARMRCLDDRLAELGALVRLFAAPDEPLARGAVATAQKLSSLAACADTKALLASDPLPGDTATRDAIVAAQGKLAEARAIYKASRPKDALALARSVTDDVTRLGHQPTLAMLHFMTGQALWVLEGAERGEPELQKAVNAAEAGKADELKVEALLQLTNLAIEGNHFDAGAERLGRTSAALARLGHDWDLEVRVLASDALLHSRQSQYEPALKLAASARELAEKHTEAPSQIYATLVEATIQNASAHPADALVGFKKVLAYHESFGHRRIEVATTLSTMASAELMVGRPDDALPHLRDALAIDEAIYGADSVEVVRALGGLAAAELAKGDANGSLATNRRALAIATKVAPATDVAQIEGQIAGNLIALGKHDEAIPYLDRALAVQTKQLGPAQVQTLTTMLTKCDALSAAGKHAAAIATCKDALAIAEKAFGRDNALLFLFVAHTGMALQAAKKPRDASAMFERAIAIGATDPADIAFLRMLDAEVLWAAGDRKRAVEEARRGHDGFAALGAEHADQAREAQQWLDKHPAR